MTNGATEDAATEDTATEDTATEDMTADMRARIAIHLLTEPGKAKVGARITAVGAPQVAVELAREHAPTISTASLEHAVARQVTRATDAGIVCVVPGSAAWPVQLDDLEDSRPVLLWVRSSAPEAIRCDLLRSISVVGSRACTAYGRLLAENLAADVGLCGWTVVSGGAYGIDAAAHAGALAVGGRTVLVTAGGADRPYPRAHASLFERVAASGAVVSEFPLGSAPARHRFLIRNRVIAAMSRGTVIVEAALRSGARATATAAAGLTRHVMAMPGPATSDLSAGTHDLIREGMAVLVSGASDVLELVTPLGEEVGEQRGIAIVRMLLRRADARTDDIAYALHLTSAEVAAQLASLEGAGLVVCGPRGWSLTESALYRYARDSA